MTVKLNLGAGSNELEGYDNSFDRDNGKEAYPLDVPDASVDEIRASHLFEHFSHREAQAVMADWVRALKPGGLLKIAVPDFEYIAEGFLARRMEPWQSYLSGAQSDDNDYHKAQYDHNGLGRLMRDAGLVGVHKWKGHGDTSLLPVSLNLAAWKPREAWPKMCGVMSVPRLGFMDNFFSSAELIARLRMPFRKTTGAFWGQCMTRSIEQALAEGVEWVLTIDYDSVYSVETAVDLIATAAAHPEVDALVPVQMSRSSGHPLMTVLGKDGKPIAGVDRSVLDATLLPIRTGHFGLTLLRAECFKDLKKPWFIGTTDPSGSWGDGRVDDDIHFWNVWKEAGNAIHCAPRCVIGHAELQILWPDENLQTVYQNAASFWSEGEPESVWK